MAHLEAIAHAQALLSRFNHFQVIQQLLADDAAWQDLTNHNGRIFAALAAILASEKNNIYPVDLYDTVYSVMVSFTKCWPRNNFDHPEGQPRVYECLIMQTPITRPLYTSIGLIVDARDLTAIIKYGKNPFTRESLNLRDIDYLKAQAYSMNIHVPKNEREKFAWSDVFKCFVVGSTFSLIMILAVSVPALLVGLLPLTLLAIPLITVPLSYLATNMWFKKTIDKKVASFSDQIKNLFSLIDKPVVLTEHEEAVNAHGVENDPEYIIDQPGLSVNAAVLIAIEPDVQASVQPVPNIVAFDAKNRHFSLLSWLNRNEPESPRDEIVSVSVGLRRGLPMLD